MTENGFRYMKRSLKHALRRVMDSSIIPNLKTKLSSQVNVKEFATMLDADVSKKLSEMARQEHMDTSPFVLEILNDALQAQSQEIQDMQNKIALWRHLTKREQEVAALACKGMTNPQIAETLHISGETVKKHISSILHKFQIKSREILRWMLEGWNFDNPQVPWKG